MSREHKTRGTTLWLPADTQTPWQPSASLERVRLERIPPRAKVTYAVWALGEATIGESHDVELAPTCVTRTDGHTQPTLVHESTTGRRVHTRDVGGSKLSVGTVARNKREVAACSRMPF
jgi:hypothetical protein